MSAPWLRLDAAVFVEPRVSSVCPPFGALAWIAILTMSKLHGWDGECPAGQVTGRALARHVGAVKSWGLRFDEALKGLEAGGLLRREGDVLFIEEWRKYQPDPTGAERQSRWRDRNARRNAVTVTNVTNGDVTGRDGRDGRDVQEPPPIAPPPEPPAPAEPEAGPSEESLPRPSTPGYLSSSLAAVLQASGVGPATFRSRPGDWWKWEKNIQGLSASGVSDERLVAALRDRKHAALMPHEFLDLFKDRDRNGRVVAPQADAMSPEEARRRARAWLAGKGGAA